VEFELTSGRHTIEVAHPNEALGGSLAGFRVSSGPIVVHRR
jgi:hypothetical protein